MHSANLGIASFQTVAAQNPSYKWYVIADSAQHHSLPNAVVQKNYRIECLFKATQGTMLARHAPHLVEMCSPAEYGQTWRWIALNGKSKPCVTVIASPMRFEEIFERLSLFMEVIMPDGAGMFLSFWDPAILGTLVGNSNDLTLHVKGPVLDDAQRAAFTSKLSRWWYWDRLGGLQLIISEENTEPTSPSPFSLTQQQVDELVEASVPDHVLFYMQLNQPLIIEGMPVSQRYSSVRNALREARLIGLGSMRDLLNYCCVALIYRERMSEDQEIRHLLNEVRQRKMSLFQAIQEFPE